MSANDVSLMLLLLGSVLMVVLLIIGPEWKFSRLNFIQRYRQYASKGVQKAVRRL